MLIKMKLLVSEGDKDKLTKTIDTFKQYYTIIKEETNKTGIKLKELSDCYKDLRIIFPSRLLTTLFFTLTNKNINEVNYLPINCNIVSIKWIDKLSILTLSGRVICSYKFIEYIDGIGNKLELIDNEYYLFLNSLLT